MRIPFKKVLPLLAVLFVLTGCLGDSLYTYNKQIIEQVSGRVLKKKVVRGRASSDYWLYLYDNNEAQWYKASPEIYVKFNEGDTASFLMVTKIVIKK